jgi:hypothetical protein
MRYHNSQETVKDFSSTSIIEIKRPVYQSSWRYLREVKRVCASVFSPDVLPLGTSAKISFTKLYT